MHPDAKRTMARMVRMMNGPGDERELAETGDDFDLNDDTTTATRLMDCLRSADDVDAVRAALLALFGRVDNDVERLKSRVGLLTKAVTLLIQGLDREPQQRHAMHTAVQRLQQTLSARQESAAAGLPVRAGSVLRDAATLAQLAHKALVMFGPRGGTAVPYDPGRAAHLVLQGVITPQQQRTWKRTGRLPDDVPVA